MTSMCCVHKLSEWHHACFHSFTHERVYVCCVVCCACHVPPPELKMNELDWASCARSIMEEAELWGLTHVCPFPADIISTVEFNYSGELLATGDKGGRVVIFQHEQEVRSHMAHGSFMSQVTSGLWVSSDDVDTLFSVCFLLSVQESSAPARGVQRL